jgi:predicted CoA-binding protein
VDDWRTNLLDEDDRILDLLAATRRIAVLGIKTERQSYQPAFSVPRLMQAAGYHIVPVPVYFPDATEILGERVYRTVSEIPGEIDMVNVFRRPRDIPRHVPDLLAKRPRSVWFQLGIRNDRAAEELARAGILVVQDRCLAIEHRRLERRRGQVGRLA